MKRHHRALAEADDREIGTGQSVLIELSIDERLDRRRRAHGAERESTGRNVGQSPPLVAAPCDGALRRMRRQEQRIRERLL